MAVTLTISPAGDDPLTQIQSTPRSTRRINATITPTGDAGEVINNVTAKLMSTGAEVTITSGATSVTIVGSYVDPFSDSFQYVSKGSSTKIETPTTIVGVDNVPRNKELFNLTQDTQATKTITYQVTVKYDDAMATPATSTYTVTHDIYNEWEGIRSFMDTYYN